MRRTRANRIGIQAHGEALTRIACLYGVRRRWFGLEPDFLFRKRVYEAAEAFAISSQHRMQALSTSKRVKLL